MSEQREEVKITLRVSTELAEAMKRLAREHDRSLNGELVRAIREYIARQRKQARLS
ncbi:MAG TPA: Arc family DNA-binding protein [Ktedonobacterales bacterium]|nr:Arc family DNA-binding protein [Ktedonobacterales bacterium]